ncbi:MAG: VOC family protein [Gammaproteobacteria bacterium]|nr:VOC family protein [Gammaproteobacteria bacterium]
MKRMHIHIAVNELSESIGFYSTLFGSAPTIKRDDYAKWSLTDPKVNFAISKREGGSSGMNHLGIQVDSESELQEIAQRLENAEINYSKQEGTTCCYARSNKHWAVDPQGIAWESFHTLSDTVVFDENADTRSEASSSCGIPNEDNATRCCA